MKQEIQLRKDSARQRSLLKFVPIESCICHFLLVNYTNLHDTSYLAPFKDIADCWSKFRFWRGGRAV